MQYPTTARRDEFLITLGVVQVRDRGGSVWLSPVTIAGEFTAVNWPSTQRAQARHACLDGRRRLYPPAQCCSMNAMRHKYVRRTAGGRRGDIHGGRSRMKGVALYRTRNGTWCLVEIPDGWRRSDPLPKDKASETSFVTRDEARP
jgi:hypothetical protein